MKEQKTSFIQKVGEGVALSGLILIIVHMLWVLAAGTLESGIPMDYRELLTHLNPWVCIGVLGMWILGGLLYWKGKPK